MRGKEKPLTVPTTVKKDHPRLCGEKVGGEGEGKDRVRITPAYAGKST